MHKAAILVALQCLTVLPTRAINLVETDIQHSRMKSAAILVALQCLAVVPTRAIKCYRQHTTKPNQTRFCRGEDCQGPDEVQVLQEQNCPRSTHCFVSVTNGIPYRRCGIIEKGKVAGALGAGQEFYPGTVWLLGQVESPDWGLCCQRCRKHLGTSLYGFKGSHNKCSCLARQRAKVPHAVVRPRPFGLPNLSKTKGSSGRAATKEEHYAGSCDSRIWEDVVADEDFLWQEGGNSKCKSTGLGKVCYCQGDNCNAPNHANNSFNFTVICFLIVIFNAFNNM